MRPRAVQLGILAALFGLIPHGCGDGGGGGDTPTALSITQLSGTYDVTLSGGSASPAGTSAALTSASVGVVGPEAPIAEGKVALTIYGRRLSKIRVSGHLEADGTVVLAGQQQGDVQALVHGSATITVVDHTQRISGTLDLADGANAFTFERPTNADLRDFAGGYAFSFAESPGSCHCASTLGIDLEFGRDGSALALFATEVDGAGHALGDFGGGLAFVSPSGGLAISETYSDRNTPSLVVLTGDLTRAGGHVTGAGEFARAAQPLFTGSWSVSR